MPYHELTQTTKYEILIEERKQNDNNFQWPIPYVEVSDYSIKPEIDRIAYLHAMHSQHQEDLRIMNTQRAIEEKKKDVRILKHVHELDKKIDTRVENLIKRNFLEYKDKDREWNGVELVRIREALNFDLNREKMKVKQKILTKRE